MKGQGSEDFRNDSDRFGSHDQVGPDRVAAPIHRIEGIFQAYAVAAVLNASAPSRAARLDVDPAARGVDRVRYWTLQGILALDAGNHTGAVRALDSARAASEDTPDPLLLLTLARALVLSDDLKPVDALIAANKDFDLLLLPNRGHGFSREPYMMRRRWDYFVRHLLGAEPPKEYTFGDG